ncbi:MAG TPA: HAD hydrolase family protein [Fibrobacteria bacterium]|nr:HAD hydrolase family protein [Fibrobacteria bacterium]
MRYHVLATDYDGTLARHGATAETTLEAMRRLKASGRKLILVTGRVLDDLKTVFSGLDLFDCIVAENGAVVHRPGTGEERVIGVPPPEAFVAALRGKGVTPMGRGRVIVSTWEAHAETVLETIKEFGLEHQVIFNKGAVMILPGGVNKAAGLAEALREMGYSGHNAVAVGDAENDNALLDSAECAVAVANALPRLKERADLTTLGKDGAGVSELAERLIATDLLELAPRLARHWITVGHREDGTPVQVDPYARGVLLVGPSGGGKTTLASAFLEGLCQGGYQFCVFDPEGDYEGLEDAVELGDAGHAPGPSEAVRVLERPGRNLVASTLGIPFADRPDFFQALLPDLLALRSRRGRPHWIMVDEAHHLMPAARAASVSNLPRETRGLFLITVEPDHVDRSALEHVDWLFAIGGNAQATLGRFARTLGVPAPDPGPWNLAQGEALVWRRDPIHAPFKMRCLPPHRELRRHMRKYSQGELGPDKHFHFRGPEGKLNLRARNLMIFLQLAEGVDEGTWLFHLRAGHYSSWFRDSIKDAVLADAVARIESREGVSPAESLGAIRDLIEARYTGPT